MPDLQSYHQAHYKTTFEGQYPAIFESRFLSLQILIYKPQKQMYNVILYTVI